MPTQTTWSAPAQMVRELHEAMYALNRAKGQIEDTLPESPYSDDLDQTVYQTAIVAYCDMVDIRNEVVKLLKQFDPDFRV